MSHPKILIASPTFEGKDYCFQRYYDSVKALTYPNFDLFLVDNSKTAEYSERLRSIGIDVAKTPQRERVRDSIVEGRNLIRQKVLDEGYDYLFSLEQDVLPPPDAIERLLSHGEKIVCGMYANPMNVPATNKKTGQREIIKINVPMVFIKSKKDPSKILPMTPQDVDDAPPFMEVGAMGLGCVLIHRSVLEKVKFRYDPEKNAFDDMFFSSDAKEAGFKLYADTTVDCVHVVKKSVWKDLKK